MSETGESERLFEWERENGEIGYRKEKTDKKYRTRNKGMESGNTGKT